MKVVLPGGSGQIGRVLHRGLVARGHELVVLSRNPKGDEVLWDGETLGAWAGEVDGADAVINLAGRSVNCRYNAENRREILESRTNSVRAVGEAIRGAQRPPKVWLQASTATIYTHRYDAPNDEATGRIEAAGPDTWRFSLNVALAWERALAEAETPATRKVALRSAITMSADRGGAFDVFLSLVRLGLGGPQGDGWQYVSWIHEDDFVEAVDFLLTHEMEGAVNLASPNPLPNREFMRALRKAWGIPFGLPAPGPIMEIGAWAMGTETELVLKSRRVVSRRLEERGFGSRILGGKRRRGSWWGGGGWGRTNDEQGVRALGIICLTSHNFKLKHGDTTRCSLSSWPPRLVVSPCLKARNVEARPGES